MSTESDAELWQRAVAGDAAAFGRIYERHDLAVTAFCLRRTGDPAAAEDLTSVVFLEAWRRRADTPLAHDSARPLLLGIATNVMRHQRRTRRRHRCAVERLQSESAPAAATRSADDRLVASQRLAALRERLEILPRRELEVLALVAWGELSYDETARALGVPVGTVRSRLSRARSRLADDPSFLASLPAPTHPTPTTGAP